MRRFVILSLAVILALSVASGVSAASLKSQGFKVPEKAIEAKVLEVLDGEVLDVEGLGFVRLIGVRGYKILDPRADKATLDDMAVNALKELVEGKTVYIEKGFEEKDAEGNTWVYMYIGDIFVNAWLIENGYTPAWPIGGNNKHNSFFYELQRDALNNQRGIWAIGRDKVYGFREAGKHYNEWGVVEGKIVDTYRYTKGGIIFLNFHQDHDRYFTAVIFKGDWDKFPWPPEQFLLNRNVWIIGNIKEYNGKPEIIINDPSQIIVF